MIGIMPTFLPFVKPVWSLVSASGSVSNYPAGIAAGDVVVLLETYQVENTSGPTAPAVPNAAPNTTQLAAATTTTIRHGAGGDYGTRHASRVSYRLATGPITGSIGGGYAVKNVIIFRPKPLSAGSSIVTGSLAAALTTSQAFTPSGAAPFLPFCAAATVSGSSTFNAKFNGVDVVEYTLGSGSTKAFFGVLLADFTTPITIAGTATGTSANILPGYFSR